MNLLRLSIGTGFIADIAWRSRRSSPREREEPWRPGSTTPSTSRSCRWLSESAWGSRRSSSATSGSRRFSRHWARGSRRPCGPSSQRDCAAEDLQLFNTHVFAGAKVASARGMAEALVKSVLVAFSAPLPLRPLRLPKLMATRRQEPPHAHRRRRGLLRQRDHGRNPSRKRETPSPLRSLLDGAGTEFDPLVVKAFVNLLGLYPLGCMVRLDSGEMATVMAPPSNRSSSISPHGGEIPVERAGSLAGVQHRQPARPGRAAASAVRSSSSTSRRKSSWTSRVPAVI